MITNYLIQLFKLILYFFYLFFRVFKNKFKKINHKRLLNIINSGIIFLMEKKDAFTNQLFSKLPDCLIHYKPMEFICTSSFCKNSRLFCPQCLISSQNSCAKTIISLESLFLPENWEGKGLENWVKDSKLRQELSNIQTKIKEENDDMQFQEENSVLDQKLEKIQEEAILQLRKILENYRIKSREVFRRKRYLYLQYKNHFDPYELIEILKSNNGPNLEKALNRFFSISAEQFFSIEEEKIEELQEKILNTFNNKTKELLKNLESNLDNNLDRIINQPMQQLLRLVYKKNIEYEMKYGNQKIDCITFECNRNIKMNGIGIYKNILINDFWNVLVSVLEGDTYKASEALLKKELFRVKNVGPNSYYLIEKLIFDVPIFIKSNKKYTISVLINGPNTAKGEGGKQIYMNGDMMFKFYETANAEKDRTNVESGQIPIIYYTFNQDEI